MINFANEFNSTIDTKTPKHLADIARAYGKEKDVIKNAEAVLKMRKAKLRDAEETLFALFEDAGISSIKVDGRPYFTRTDMYASIDSKDKVPGFQWLYDEEYDHLITKTVNAQSLTRAIKEVVASGGDMPGVEEGIIVRTVNRVSAPQK